MRQRGSSVLEILVATAISVTAFLAIVSFFLATLRFGRDMDAQAALQRQGSAIAEELGRRLRQMGGGSPLIEDPANPPDLPACLPLPTTDMVLVIPNPSDGSNTCVYRSTDSPPQIVRCTRPQVYASADPCTPVANMLDGSLVALSAACAPGSTCTPWSLSPVTPCTAAGGTCDAFSVCSVANQSCATVPVTEDSTPRDRNWAFWWSDDGWLGGSLFGSGHCLTHTV